MFKWVSIFTIAVFTGVGAIRLDGQTIVPGVSSVTTTFGPAEFKAGLLDFDHDITKHPPRFTGTGIAAKSVMRIGRFPLGIETFRNSVGGDGQWGYTKGMTAEEAAYAPIPNGHTRFVINGVDLGPEVSFCDRKKAFCAVFGIRVGAATLSGEFNGTAQITDPDDGTQSVVPANSRFWRLIPALAADAGTDWRIKHSAFAIHTEVNWKLGVGGAIGIKLTQRPPEPSTLISSR